MIRNLNDEIEECRRYAEDYRREPGRLRPGPESRAFRHGGTLDLFSPQLRIYGARGAHVEPLER